MGRPKAFKPNKGVLKRVKVTATGKIKVRRPGKSHLLSGKSGNRRRKLRRPLTTSPLDTKKARLLLGI